MPTKVEPPGPALSARAAGGLRGDDKRRNGYTVDTRIEKGVVREIVVIDSPSPEEEQAKEVNGKGANGKGSNGKDGHSNEKNGKDIPSRNGQIEKAEKSDSKRQKTDKKRKIELDSMNAEDIGLVEDPTKPPTYPSALAPVPPHLRNKVLDDKDGHYIVEEKAWIGARYVIKKKLGQGTFGKVVEAFDTQRNKSVAIKVIRAVEKYRDASRIEIRALNKLSQADPTNQHQCIAMLDWFDYRNHICIVTELLSMSIFDFMEQNEWAAFPQSHIQSFARQLLDAVGFMHSLGLIHTDLKPENILLCASDYVVLNWRRRVNGTWKTRRVLKNTKLKLIDFGSTIFDHEYHSSVVSTRHYRAPEIILGLGWSFPCDIYSLGCIFVEFLIGAALFQTHDNNEHLAMMEIILGPMEPTYTWKARNSEFVKDGIIVWPKPETAPKSIDFLKSLKPIERIIDPTGTDIIGQAFLKLVKKMLSYEQSDRGKVADCLSETYFTLRIKAPFTEGYHV